jgi:endonuclease YncB( thermonuclease family)
MKIFAAIAALFAMAPVPIDAAMRSRVEMIIDGDTFTLARRVAPWGLRIDVRIRGIDTPEAGARSRCAEEARRADAAMWHLRALIAVAGDRVTLSRVRHDKYGGRIDADVSARVGSHDRDLAVAMIEAGHAVPYAGEGPRKNWCPGTE